MCNRWLNVGSMLMSFIYFFVFLVFHHDCSQAFDFLFFASDFLQFVSLWLYRGPLLWNRKLL